MSIVTRIGTYQEAIGLSSATIFTFNSAETGIAPPPRLRGKGDSFSSFAFCACSLRLRFSFSSASFLSSTLKTLVKVEANLLASKFLTL
ncbi:hypothetical protein BGP_6528 [Beggiatoa sp. PS]|nr:hypothetical protein BGP_6528 [Beggiatoa sp. PS]